MYNCLEHNNECRNFSRHLISIHIAWSNVFHRSVKNRFEWSVTVIACHRLLNKTDPEWAAGTCRRCKTDYTTFSEFKSNCLNYTIQSFYPRFLYRTNNLRKTFLIFTLVLFSWMENTLRDGLKFQRWYCLMVPSISQLCWISLIYLSKWSQYY